MRAAAYDRTGPAKDVLTLIELPTPEPGPGEVRVRLATSGINPSDVKTRGGTRTKVLAFPQIVPHSDGAGVIDAVGAGVDSGRIGERVWTWNAAWGRPHGTAAQYIVLPSAQAVQLPERVDFAAGACLGIPALTAYHAVVMDGGVKDKTVLVAGGAGAVGHYAIQFARLRGARQIITTVSSQAKAQIALAAGADVTIDYRKEDVAARVLELTNGAGVNRVIEVDLHANVKLDFAVTAANGDIVIYGSNVPEVPVNFVQGITKNLQLRFFIVYNLTAADRARELAEFGELLASGRLQHNVTDRFPLDRIAEAHERVESGQAGGNVVLDIS
ncbi:NADPH2:quinone reductase [Panacagrimonas perspica]|uniref:NADPH2:quinone reductase n=1 Tax=Panacagrimonas perspica TaxID=381431 RepID=A0A4S3JYX9_9GAMM|nr:NADPH:quinone reductase [Panacagrimonas perspica]TDU25675.1 NADPH2:quinone reductase [Panacagrimonas perspica]THD00708.1 NADPH:quinone oxidoreductase [Panacagrimonas perspica]